MVPRVVHGEVVLAVVVVVVTAAVRRVPDATWRFLHYSHSVGLHAGRCSYGGSSGGSHAGCVGTPVYGPGGFHHVCPLVWLLWVMILRFCIIIILHIIGAYFPNSC